MKEKITPRLSSVTPSAGAVCWPPGSCNYETRERREKNPERGWLYPRCRCRLIPSVPSPDRITLADIVIARRGLLAVAFVRALLVSLFPCIRVVGPTFRGSGAAVCPVSALWLWLVWLLSASALWPCPSCLSCRPWGHSFLA